MRDLSVAIIAVADHLIEPARRIITHILDFKNVAVITAMAHVVVTEGLVAEDYVRERCDPKSFGEWREFVAGLKTPQWLMEPSVY